MKSSWDPGDPEEAESRVAEFEKDHPELVDAPTQIDGQGELFGEEEAGHKRQPYEMSAEEFIHDPGVWWHGTKRMTDVNRHMAGWPYQGTHLGTLEAAGDVLHGGTTVERIGIVPTIHPVRVAEGVLPTSTHEELIREMNHPYEPTIAGRLGPEVESQRGPDGVWADQGEDQEWDTALGTVNTGPRNRRTRGLLYRNAIEDEGSVSATVPDQGTMTVRDWIRKGMAEHPERVHPSLQHWVDTTGGRIDYSTQAHERSHAEQWRHPVGKKRPLLGTPDPTQVEGQLAMSFDAHGRPEEPYKTFVPPRGTRMHEAVIASETARRRGGS